MTDGEDDRRNVLRLGQEIDQHGAAVRDHGKTIADQERRLRALARRSAVVDRIIPAAGELLLAVFEAVPVLPGSRLAAAVDAVCEVMGDIAAAGEGCDDAD
jgi:hypothetical protein